MTIRLYLESILFSLLINAIVILVFKLIFKDACKKGNLGEYVNEDACEVVRDVAATIIILSFVPVCNMALSLLWICVFIVLIIWNGVKSIMITIFPDK